MAERGEIRNRAYAAQIRDFRGLRFGKITPTDIDGFLDFGDRLFVFVESKFGGSAMPYGQRLALQRLCDSCHVPPRRHAIVLIAAHMSDTDIDFANSKVTEYRWFGKWIHEGRSVTVRAAIDGLVNRYLREAVNA